MSGYVADASLADELAEIGVMLLMFGVDLHISIADRVVVRRSAIPGAVGQIATAIGIGLTHAGAGAWGRASRSDSAWPL